MEFIRFGSSIPGAYWGCCACCVIQNFNFDPDAKMSIQLVSGDAGSPTMIKKDGKFVSAFAGPTYRDIFHQRLRIGTFDSRDMPNHAFLAILTEDQAQGKWGKAWLKILKEAGFEFIRSVSNSVYQGQTLSVPKGEGGSRNYIFGLFRNIGAGSIEDQFVPPAYWSSMPECVPEPYTRIPDTKKLTLEQHDAALVIWNRIGAPKLLTEEEVVAAGAPVILAGLRSLFPQQSKKQRETMKASSKKEAVAGDPFTSDVSEGDDEDDYEPEYDDDGDEIAHPQESYPTITNVIPAT